VAQDRAAGRGLAGGEHAEFCRRDSGEFPPLLPDRDARGAGRADRAHAGRATLASPKRGDSSMNDIAVLSNADRVALDDIDVSDPKLYQDDVYYPYFARLRREDPVHYCRESLYGPYWSVTKYKDIMQVEINHQVFSSDAAISILDPPKGLERQSFIAMDPPKHDEQRLSVSPAVAPGNLANMEGLIRERTARVLDGLPRNETFDWVDRVSVELTTMMLATLFDYPWEDRRQLTYWSDVAICNVDAPESPVHSEEEKYAEMTKMTEALGKLFNERAQQPPKF